MIWAGALLALAFSGSADARTYTVNKSADPGPERCQFKRSKAKKNRCSLRSAIHAANAHNGADTIRFGIGTGPKAITPESELPALTDKVTLDGWTQEGFKNKPLIEIDGAGFSTADGILISNGANGSTVRGLILNGNSNHGIRVFHAAGPKIKGCWIGLEPDGNTAQPVGSAGIMLDDASGAVIGGAGAKSRNVISGNSGDGIDATSPSAVTTTTITGNRIGTNAAGTTALGNGGSGINLTNAPGTITIGTPGAGNLISGNGQDGVRLADYDIAHGPVTMQANLIGTNAAGTAALGNGDDGIDHQNPFSNHIGGSTAAARNLISGNGAGSSGAGIHFKGAFPDAFGIPDNWIRGNRIGINAPGLQGLGNAHSGVWLDSTSPGVQVGGTPSGEGNVIAGSEGGVGLRIEGSRGATVLNNKLGVNKDAQIVGNALDNAVGIELTGGSFHFIGVAQDGTAAGNVIGNNGVVGVRISGGSSRYIADNSIGAGPGGGTDLGNGTDPATDAGILIRDGADAQIGADALGFPAPNIIAYNHGDGIRIEDDSYVELTRNSTAFNDGLGIDLAGGTENSFGITANDEGAADDGDTGPNLLMNQPVVTGVAPISTGANYTVSMDAKPSSTYRVEVFADVAAECDDATGNREGGFFIGGANLGTGADGTGSVTFFRSGAISAGTKVTATASFDELEGTGIAASSEYGPCFTVP